MSTFLKLLDVNVIVIACRESFRPDEVCLACLHGDARLELLTGPWEGLLGISRAELDGRPLHRLLAGGPDEAEAALQRLLDPLGPEPVLVQVRMKDGSVRSLHIYRRFDPYEPSLYLACEPFEGIPPRSRTSSSVSFRSNP